jgi:hypothetical protein
LFGCWLTTAEEGFVYQQQTTTICRRCLLSRNQRANDDEWTDGFIFLGRGGERGRGVTTKIAEEKKDEDGVLRLHGGDGWKTTTKGDGGMLCGCEFWGFVGLLVAREENKAVSRQFACDGLLFSSRRRSTHYSLAKLLCSFHYQQQ